jgi:hypothetical protein
MATNTAWQSAAQPGSFTVNEVKYSDLSSEQKSLFNKQKSALVRIMDEAYYHQLRLGAGSNESLRQFVNYLIVNETDKIMSFYMKMEDEPEALAQHLADNAGFLIQKIRLGDTDRFMYEGMQLKIVKGRGSSKKTTKPAAKKPSAKAATKPAAKAATKPTRRSGRVVLERPRGRSCSAV